MTPEAWCNQMAQQAILDRKKRVRYAEGQGFFRVHWLKPRKETGPYPTVERAWLANPNYFRAAESYDLARATPQGEAA